MRRAMAMVVTVLALSYSLLPPVHLTGVASAHTGSAPVGGVDSLSFRRSTATATAVPPSATPTNTPAPPTASDTAIATATASSTASATATSTAVPASATATGAAGAAPSLLVNGGFDQSGPAWAAPWTLSLTAPAVATLSQDSSTFVDGSASAAVNVTTAVPTAGWDAQLGQGGLSLVVGTSYTLSFWAKSAANQPVMASVQQTVSPYGGRAKQWFTLTPNWQQYTLTFTAPYTEGNIGVVFNVGAAGGTIRLDAISFTDPPTSPTPSATTTPSSVPSSATPTATVTPALPTATATAIPSATTTAVSATAAPSPGGSGTVQDFPRLANLYGFGTAGQAGAFARYGLLVGNLGPADAVQALKNQNPNTKALFYLDSLSVDVPGFDGMSIYPGWWLTLAGTTLSAALDAGSTTVHVANAAVINNYLGSNPDVLVDGESMHVTSVNVGANTLTVQRGYYSTASSHASGARLAAHATKWPGTWMLNVSTYCPTNPSTGQTWIAYLAQQVQKALAAAQWDGVYYDDSNNNVDNYDHGQIDANNDNVADGGDGPSGTGWATGESNLVSQTHSLASSALIVGNGAVYPGSSGREMEHFPYYNNGYASGFETYLQLAGPQGTAPTTILNADTSNTGAQSLQAMRFNLATALMGNGYYAYDYGTQLHGQTWWYDEYDAGAGSSLASAISWNQTNLPLASGTGSKFQVGDIVRVPDTDNSPNAIDDEQMLVTGVSGDTLYVQRGYNGALATDHAAQTKVFTATQEAAGRGWLGQPLGPASSVSSGGANQLQNGSFEQGGAGWLSPWTLSMSGGGVASTAQDTSTAASGSASAKITISQAVPSAPWDIQLSQGGLSTSGGTTYTLSFWAKSSTNQQVMASTQQTVSPYGGRAKQWFTLTPNWQQYTLTFTASNTEGNLGAVFNLGSSTGTIWLDGISFGTGDPNLWRRDFTHGTVLLNATSSAQTVTVGSGYARIAGTQDPATNSGAAVTISAQDAILLRKTG